MVATEVNEIVSLLPNVKYPFKHIGSSYDEEADVLYLNFKKPNRADDSELTGNDIIIRYEKGEIAGIAILQPAKDRRHSATRTVPR